MPDYFPLAAALALNQPRRIVLTDDQRQAIRVENDRIFTEYVLTWFKRTDPPASGDGSAGQ